MEPSKGTNTLPPAWQFSLSWGGASDEEKHRAPGWRDGQAARDARNSPQAARVQRDALLASFLLASPPPKTMQGGSWWTAPSVPSPREQPCCRGERCEEQPSDLAPAPRSGVSIPLQARGHHRSRTPRAQCSSADPTEAKGWCACPLRSSPNARKHSSSTKCLK